jgi:hypothetical protein
MCVAHNITAVTYFIATEVTYIQHLMKVLVCIGTQPFMTCQLMSMLPEDHAIEPALMSVMDPVYNPVLALTSAAKLIIR